VKRYSGNRGRTGDLRPAPKLTPEQSAKLDERLLAIDLMMKSGDSRPLTEKVVQDLVKKTAKDLHSFPSRKR